MEEKKEMVKTEENIEKTSVLKSIAPVVDIYENDDEILVYADMPGVAKDQITVDIDNGRLTISGIRKLNRPGVDGLQAYQGIEYVRKFSIPQTIDVEKVEAELKNGVLTLQLPKSETAKPRQIEIKAA